MHCLAWPPPADQSETAASARVGCLTSVCSFSTAYIILATRFDYNMQHCIIMVLYLCYIKDSTLIVRNDVNTPNLFRNILTNISNPLMVQGFDIIPS